MVLNAISIFNSFNTTLPKLLKSNSNAAPGIFVGAGYFSYGTSPNCWTVSYSFFLTCSTTHLNFNLSISGIGLSSQRSTLSNEILTLFSFCQINAPSQPLPNGIASSHLLARESKDKSCCGFTWAIRFVQKKKRKNKKNNLYLI